MKNAKTKKETINTPPVETKNDVISKKPKVELVSYSIKMTIPTAQFANIIPEIVVKAGTVEEAHDYIAPHMNKLWKEYYMISERPAVSTKPVATNGGAGVCGGNPGPLTPTNQGTNTTPMPPATAVAFEKASQAVASCLSQDALDLIATQIKKSVKLSDVEKDKLMVLVINKQKELNGGNPK